MEPQCSNVNEAPAECGARFGDSGWRTMVDVGVVLAPTFTQDASTVDDNVESGDYFTPVFGADQSVKDECMLVCRFGGTRTNADITAFCRQRAHDVASDKSFAA